jgi:D-beta-D-heptose 7-phosphate kinase/D-beta-D-heptose 1-phosphate adenosyltransferase
MRKTVAVSGGFDPIHPGHIAYIEEALRLDVPENGPDNALIVILTRDDQLWLKKMKQPIPYEVRKAVIEWGLKGRGTVVENVDMGDITSIRSLGLYRPDIYAKGGDTWDLNNLPEKEICEILKIEVVFGVGGYDKKYSSSKLR